jgi:hypothetical protein
VNADSVLRGLHCRSRGWEAVTVLGQADDPDRYRRQALGDVRFESEVADCLSGSSIRGWNSTLQNPSQP